MNVCHLNPLGLICGGSEHGVVAINTGDGSGKWFMLIQVPGLALCCVQPPPVVVVEIYYIQQIQRKAGSKWHSRVFRFRVVRHQHESKSVVFPAYRGRT